MKEQLTYGKDYQIKFLSEEEKYKAIGYLCNPNNCNIYILKIMRKGVLIQMLIELNLKKMIFQ